MTSYIAYVDDSGDQTTAVYTAILMPLESWTQNLEHWLKLRRNLFTTYGVPATFEIHANELVGGKDLPSAQFTYGRSTLRERVLEMAARTICTMPDIRIVSKVMPHVTPANCYRALLSELESLLLAEDSWAFMVVDGEDASHKAAHRDLSLDSRRIVEDPWFHDSKRSQFVQMADVASYSVFQSHSLRSSRQFMWSWMKSFFHQREWSGHCSCPS